MKVNGCPEALNQPRPLRDLWFPISLLASPMRSTPLVLLLFVAACARPVHLAIPAGAPITVDGRLAPDEWRDAARFVAFDNGGDVLLKHDAQYLYLGIRTPRRGFPSVCVTQADTVRVLHASAALGALRYEREGADWARRNEFDFGMRSPDTTAEARALRAEYLRTQGWVASTVRMGSGVEKEMIVPLAFLGSPARLAIAYYVLDDENAPLSLWPSTVADACSEKRLAQGYAEPRLVFGGRGWAQLQLAR